MSEFEKLESLREQVYFSQVSKETRELEKVLDSHNLKSWKIRHTAIQQWIEDREEYRSLSHYMETKAVDARIALQRVARRMLERLIGQVG